ncbi:hypothetical protein PCORN_18876 [Listeria cornellensis FSL F6-0969]|nr:hypothetical protein PCORN_18876 [Listeria cornellensis FSL F6-0969]
MGNLSVYEATDFTVIHNDFSNYEIVAYNNINEFTHNDINYVNFYEDYYNDIPDAVVRLKKTAVRIYQSDCSKDELVKFICNETYSTDEKCFVLEAVSEKIVESDITTLILYFSEEKLSQDIELAEEFLCLLSKYKNENVYQYFLDYFSVHVGENTEIDQIISTYFDEYYL